MSLRNVLVALGLCAGLVAAAGCQQGVAREEFDSLKQHNSKLMNENAQLRTEYEQMKADEARMAAAPQAPAFVEPAAPALTKPTSDFDKIKSQPLPPGVSVVDRGGKAVIRIEGAMVNYGAGKAALTPDGKQAMEKVAIILNREFPTRTVVVEGHTDSQPIVRTANLYKNNWELGMKRATEVVDYLQIKGVDPRRIRAVSLGEHQPLADNGSTTGRAKNRRVEVVVMPEDAVSAPTPTASIPY